MKTSRLSGFAAALAALALSGCYTAPPGQQPVYYGQPDYCYGCYNYQDMSSTRRMSNVTVKHAK